MGAPTLIGVGHVAAVSVAGGASLYAPGASTILYANTGTESNAAVAIKTAGAVTRLTITMAANNRTSAGSVVTRIGGSTGNGALTITVGSGAATWTDATGSDSVGGASSTALTFWAVMGTGGNSSTVAHLGAEFTASGTDAVSILASAVALTPSAAAYSTLMGHSGSTATEATSAASYMPTAGTLRNVAVNVTVNSRNGASEVKLRKNATTNGNNVLTISQGAGTGIFELTGTDDAVTAGNYWAWCSTPGGTTGSLTWQYAKIEFVSSAGLAVSQTAVVASSASLALTTGQVNVVGQLSAVGSEPAAAEGFLAGRKVWAKGVYVHLVSNGRNGDCTVTLRNGAVGALADTSMVITLPASSGAGVWSVTGSVLLDGPTKPLVDYGTSRGGNNGTCAMRSITLAYAVEQTLAATGVASTTTVGSPEVSVVGGTFQINPGGVGSTLAIGTAVLAGPIRATGVGSSLGIGGATVSAPEGGGVTDDFNRAGPGLGADWELKAWGPCSISSNQVVPDDLASIDSAYLYIGTTFADDQYSQAKIWVTGSHTDGAGFGVAVRIVRVGETTLYRVVIDATGAVSLQRFYGGAFAVLDSWSVTYVAGGVLRLEIVGDLLTVKYEGATVGSYDATADQASYPIPSGSAGFSYSCPESSAALDDWGGGDLVPGLQTLSPGAVASTVGIGGAKVAGPITASGVASTLGIGTAVMTGWLGASGVASTAAVGSPVLSGWIAAVGIASTVGVGTATVSQVGAGQTLSPGGRASLLAIGGPTVSLSALQTISATGRASTVSIGGQTHHTQFPVDENPLSEGGEWIGGATVGLDWHDFAVANHRAYGTQPGNILPDPQLYDDSVSLLAGDWAPDQGVEGVVYNSNPPNGWVEELELRLRSDLSAHSCTGYEVLFNMVNSGMFAVVRWNGAREDYDVLTGYLSGEQYVVVTGDVIRAEISGTNPVRIRVWKNGTLLATVDDSNASRFLTGRPGIGAYLADNTGVNQDYSFSRVTAWDATGTRVEIRLGATGRAATSAAGAPTLQPGAVTVSPSAVASTVAIGTGTLGLSVLPAGLASTLAFGSPALAVMLAPSGRASTLAIGSAALAYTLDMTGVGSTLAIGGAGVEPEQFLMVSGVASTVGIGAASVLVGVTTLGPNGVASTLALGGAQLDLHLAVGGVASTLGLGSTLRVSYTLRASGVGSTLAQGSTTVLPGTVTLSPGGLGSTLAVGIPVLSVTGITQIAPTGRASTLALGVPRLDYRLLASSRPSTLAVGTPALGFIVAPTGRASTLGLGDVLLTLWLSLIQPSAVASTLAIGRPRLFGPPGSAGPMVAVMQTVRTRVPTGQASSSRISGGLSPHRVPVED